MHGDDDMAVDVRADDGMGDSRPGDEKKGKRKRDRKRRVRDAQQEKPETIRPGGRCAAWRGYAARARA
jgi:hypothetical protein